MARTSNITFGQVAAIADAMKAAGNRPTARAVRERIGSGSMGTIHRLLQQWQGKASEQDEETEAAELPQHIQSALMDFIGTEIATACEPINEDLQAAKEAAEELAAENVRLEAVIDRLQTERDNAERNQATSKALYDKTNNELKAANAQLQIWADVIKNQEIELDRASRQLEMLASYAPELAQAKIALGEMHEKAATAEKEAAVLGAQLTAKTEKADELDARLKSAESRANAATEEAKQANNHYQAMAARLEATAREIESLRKPKPAKAPAAPKASTRKTTKPTDGNS